MKFSSIVVAVASIAVLQATPLCVAQEAPASAVTAVNTNTPPTADVDGEFIIGPDHPAAPELTRKVGVPQGDLHFLKMPSSTNSALFPGIRGPYNRSVIVYVPKQYIPGTAAALLVVHDGEWHTNTVPVVLDNLIHEKKLPVMIAVLAHNGGGDSRGSERGLEYDTVSGKYAEYIEKELLPWVAKELNVKFTTDPEARATMGGSSGGSAAFAMAWFHPEWYHKVLTYSGTYVNQQSPLNPESPHGAWNFHETLIPNSERKPLRIWLEVSDRDNGANSPESGFHNWVIANRHMAAVLKEKGYHYQFVYALNAGHTDGKVTRQTLPEALLWLWHDYPIK